MYNVPPYIILHTPLFCCIMQYYQNARVLCIIVICADLVYIPFSTFTSTIHTRLVLKKVTIFSHYTLAIVGSIRTMVWWEFSTGFMELTKPSVAPRVTIVTSSSWGSAPPVSSTPTPQRERGAPVIKPKLRRVTGVLARLAAVACRSRQIQGNFAKKITLTGLWFSVTY